MKPNLDKLRKKPKTESVIAKIPEDVKQALDKFLKDKSISANALFNELIRLYLVSEGYIDEILEKAS